MCKGFGGVQLPFVGYSFYRRREGEGVRGEGEEEGREGRQGRRASVLVNTTSRLEKKILALEADLALAHSASSDAATMVRLASHGQ